MKDGFIKCAAANIKTVVADTSYNFASITEQIIKADEQKVNLLVLPELCITGYSCGDLFLSDTLINNAADTLLKIADFTTDKYPAVVVGLPVRYQNRLYNCAAVIYGGEILGLVPKTDLKNSGEHYEKRYFAAATDLSDTYNCVNLGGEIIPLNEKVVFASSECHEFRFGVTVGDNLLAVDSQIQPLCASGANIIVNCAASAGSAGKGKKRLNAIKVISEKLKCGYIFSNASTDESTTDSVFDGQLVIAESGSVIAENIPLSENRFVMSEIDVNMIGKLRTADTSFSPKTAEGFNDILFSQPINHTVITKKIAKNPFISDNKKQADDMAQEALIMQSYALKKRFEHSHAKTMVIGISGGLDSCLALLSAVNCADLMNIDRQRIIAVTMPCFGTTKRTRSNAELLCEALGVTFKTVDITNAVNTHFSDIGQKTDCHDVTYENAQARERTQVLMDIANMENGLVIGTGDLSELALGWATYNGDHMSMYGVNAAIPKTVVRYLVKYTAQNSCDTLKNILLDIIDTPVSPELLPGDENGDIKQITEDVVGPYELHDFFIYHTLRFGFSPAKIFRLASHAFAGEYDDGTILKWLKTFVRRFFVSQFKRSCLPDGVKIYDVSLSPRSDWRMPSDASAKIWLDELDSVEF